MRILILTQVYPPERHPTAIMVKQLSRHLAERGHEVAVATGLPSHPSPAEFRDGTREFLSHTTDGGVTVLRCWHPRPRGRGLSSRASGMAAHLVAAILASMRFRAPDAVICFGYPLAGPILASLRTLRSKTRLITVIYDIYPDVAIDTGAVTNRTLIAGLRVSERYAYERSSRIVVLSDGFRRALLDRGVPDDKLEVIPVWLEEAEVAPQPRENRWRLEQGIESDRFIALYAGTLGLVSGCEVILEAAEALRNHSTVEFLVVGDGAAKPALVKSAFESGLTNIRFLPFQPRSRLTELQATADVSLLTLAPGRGHTSVPSKLIGYIAAGRPVIASVDEDSDSATCTRDAGGIVTPPGDGVAMGQAILKFASDSAAAALAARSARRHFERNFGSRRCLARWARVVEDD